MIFQKESGKDRVNLYHNQDFVIDIKDFIEKQLGKIRVKSECGKGTEFMFTLPVLSKK